uniref:Leucine-rich repeat-containing N-terminal plant-type domain-containing protein n=1 Tax=Fagus sylvatica TaxID=28930 RepID=A0A2N9FF82_FAGSY
MQPLCHDDESLALLQFKESFIINKSACLDDPFAYPKVKSWTLEGESSNCCSWDGVSCDEDTGHVIGLDLSSSCLYGSINSNSSLFRLVHLQSLNLAHNHFKYSQIPSQIGNLSRLTYLNLSSSMFSGQIPFEVSKLSQLSSLYLCCNIDLSSWNIKLLQLKELSLTSLVENLTRLENLDLGGVTIVSTVPNIFANLSTLRSLYLHDCGMYGEFPRGIFKLPNLRILDMKYNKNLTGSLPDFQNWRSHLKEMTFADTSFSGELPASMGNLGSLIAFDMWGCNLSGSIPYSIGNLTNLVYLQLSNNSLAGPLDFNQRSSAVVSARALTNAASTPVSFWGEAALTAVYTINRCPSPVIQNTTPYERLFGTAPNYSLLKVFGCVCFVLLQPHERTKLQPRSQLCCFLGYGLEEKGYRCYDPVAKRLRVSRHVVFWEHKMFYSLPSFSAGNDDSQADPLPNLFPEIPSPSAESVNPISDESPSADPSSDVSPTTDPTFNESPLSAPAANPVNTTAPEPRRSHRVSTLPSHLRDFHCFSAFATLHEPHTFREASSDPLWQQAMKEELDALLKTGTWDLVDLPAGKSAIGCKWVYKIKTRSDGTVDRYKARLVAKGFTQEYGIDYEETFAPVARLSSVRTLIAVSASRHWPLFQMDVKNAFLNGELTEEVYMQLPPGFSQPPGFSHKVCRLRRALYGLKQAPRAWFAKFSSTISQHGFSASSYDSALFFRRSDHGITLLLLYVDDMIITGDDVQGIQDLKRFLGQHFEMKDLGPLSYFLGLEVSSSSDGYYLTQAKYTSDLISRAGITDSKIVDTPIEYNNRLNTHDGEPLPDATLYRQLVGSLVYLTVTRPDISYAVHIVSQFMAAPRSLHYAAVLRILRYLKGTLFHGLHFSSQSSLTLQAYSDADWAGDPTDRRSTTGYCFLLGDSLISWRSKKQSVVARSSTEAEYRALADTTAELLWLRWLLQDLGIDCSTAVPIHCDNRSAIQIAHNDVFHERTKHIEIDCHFVRHHLLQGTLQLRSVSSQDQLADIFTKPMPPGRFRDLISKLKLVSLHPT